MDRDELCDWESWDRPGQTVSLVVIGAACLAWWAASLTIGPVWLAARRHDRELADDTWPSGDRA
jgi:hypothetical protein